MKKTWLFTVFICLLIIAGGGAVVLWPRTIPFDKCSESYKIYANNPSVEASFIKDFRINDTIFVDVTLLEAVDSNGWNILKHDFCLPNLELVFQQNIEIKEDMIFVRVVNKDNYCESVDESIPECNILATSFTKHTLCVFNVSNLCERYAVLHYNYDKSTNQNNI